jgi:mono/diheme cytochrome c family protein
MASAAITIRASADDSAAVKAGAVFDRHCARCHQVGRLENPPAKGGLGNLLDLERLIERDDLIVPSDPDASRLYQIMLTRHRPQSVFFGPVPGPTPAEIGAVREWLAGLPAPSTQCADKPAVTIADTQRDIAAWRKAFESDSTKPLRFVSLANLHNLCRSDAMLAAYRDAIATLMSRLTLRSVTTLDTVGDASVLLAFRPSDLGLTAEAWDLRAGKGEHIPGVVAAEALAARALAAASAPQPPPDTGVSPISVAVAAQAPALIDGLDPVDALAHEYTRTVSLERAAVELGLKIDEARTRLAAMTGDEKVLALRLVETGLPRDEWEPLKALLMDRSWPRDSAPLKEESLKLALWTDALAYTTGDLLTVHARPSRDCNLTVIAVEADGLATVLFPNDTTTENRVTAGTLVQIPPDGAPFQLRLDKPGRHGVVAICNATAKRPQGIGHDFERQRFTVLGDWRTFLLQTAEREAAYQKTQDELSKFRTGAGGAEMLDEQLPQGTEDEARVGLTVEVK